MVHQHFKLVHNYTVTENIILGLEPRNRFGGLDLASAEKRVAKISEQYGLAVDPRAKIESITVGMQQRVEILKILYRDANILIFDEPTAVLTPQEVDELMAILKRLKAEGEDHRPHHAQAARNQGGSRALHGSAPRQGRRHCGRGPPRARRPWPR